jgi:predicted GIY-YIG superfamily endonuclease
MSTTRARPGRTAVYRLYAQNGRLLYVGITNSPPHRFAQHAADKPWWADVDERVTEINWHPTRNAALRAEKALIQRYRPEHNVQHHPDRRSRYAAERPTDGWSRQPFSWPAAGLAAGGFCIGSLAGWWDAPWWMSVAAVAIAARAFLFTK